MSEEEVLKLFKDKLYRLNHLYYIQNEKGEKVKFCLRENQEKFLSEMHSRNIILKARQLGFSTLIDLWMLDECIFNSHTQAAIIAQTKDDVKEIFDKKIKFPWEHLPEELKSQLKETSSSANKLSWENGSSIRVAQSVRSSTLQILHVSEFGKISVKYPDKAKEIVTGSLNALHEGAKIFIESTAEGDEGRFFDMCQKARVKIDEGKPLNEMDYKFHFYPWWQEKKYTLSEKVVITQALREYFEKLEQSEGIYLNEQQKYWYAQKWEENGDDMFSEFPSTPDEAFKSTKEGRYFNREMSLLRTKGQIRVVPYNDKIKVYTGWDLGVGDPTCLFFAQVDGPFINLIDLFELQGESLDYFAKILEKKADELGYRYDTHFLPHDGANRQLGHKRALSTENILKEDYGLNVRVTERIKSEGEGINLIRKHMPYLWIDEEKCAYGIKALDNFKREFDYKRGVYSDKYFHNWASHPTKALQTLLLGLQSKKKKKNSSSYEDVIRMNKIISNRPF